MLALLILLLLLLLRQQWGELQEIDELFKIFQVLGTPNESSWPGVSAFPDYKDTFPQWAPKPLRSVIPSLDPAGDSPTLFRQLKSPP